MYIVVYKVQQLSSTACSGAQFKQDGLILVTCEDAPDATLLVNHDATCSLQIKTTKVLKVFKGNTSCVAKRKCTPS